MPMLMRREKQRIFERLVHWGWTMPSGLTWLVIAALSPLGGRVRLCTRSMTCRGREARLGYRLPASAVLSTKANLIPALLSWAGTISAAISRY